MAYNRRPLRDRENVLSDDVADAIERIVSTLALPRAIAKIEIVAKLIEIAQTDDKDVYTPPAGPARNAMEREFINRLTNTAVFQSGYKRYEKRAAVPVVPVTDYFFRVVYGGGAVDDVLDAMTDFEIVQSLPKRRGRVAVENEGTFDHLRDEESGEILIFGELAGVVVFPENSRASLLRSWLERRAATTAGAIAGTVAAIEHARPDTKAVETMKQHMRRVDPLMRRALPSPKKES